jgi:hypothetical protein
LLQHTQGGCEDALTPLGSLQWELPHINSVTCIYSDSFITRAITRLTLYYFEFFSKVQIGKVSLEQQQKRVVWDDFSHFFFAICCLEMAFSMESSKFSEHKTMEVLCTV